MNKKTLEYKNKIFDILQNVFWVIVVVILLYFVLELIIFALQAFYAPVSAYGEFLIATSVLITMFALAVTAYYNYKSLNLIRDEYQPVASVSYENLPPTEHDTTIITITNVGKKNLYPSSIKITGSWFNNEISIDPYVDHIAPGEDSAYEVELSIPLPDIHRLFVTITDDENELEWKKTKLFRIRKIHDISVST